MLTQKTCPQRAGQREFKPHNFGRERRVIIQSSGGCRGWWQRGSRAARNFDESERGTGLRWGSRAQYPYNGRYIISHAETELTRVISSVHVCVCERVCVYVYVSM